MQKNENLYTIFSYDYWKIKAFKKLSKKEKNLDLWYLVNFEIETKNNTNIHKIKNIKIISEFKTENVWFSIINKYLEILSIIYKQIPDWVSVYEIFEIIEIINSKENISEIQLILSKLKILAISWELNIKHKNKTVFKILKFVSMNCINDIFRLCGISEEIKKELEGI